MAAALTISSGSRRISGELDNQIGTNFSGTENAGLLYGVFSYEEWKRRNSVRFDSQGCRSIRHSRGAGRFDHCVNGFDVIEVNVIFEIHSYRHIREKSPRG